VKGGVSLGQSSETLIKEILKGNEAAMELLVKKNYNMIQSFIYRFIGDYNLSYDMTQEVFIKMMKNLNRFKFEDGNFESWLLKMASNHCKDYFRSNSFKQRNESSNIGDLDIEDNAAVIDILEKNEKRKAVKKAVDGLSNLQREAIILKYYHDLKIKEISHITGYNENTVKSRLFNGIKNLKKIIGGDEDEWEKRFIK